MKLNEVVIKEGKFKPSTITMEFSIETLEDLREFQAVNEDGIECNTRSIIGSGSELNLLSDFIKELSTVVISEYNK